MCILYEILYTGGKFINLEYMRQVVFWNSSNQFVGLNFSAFKSLSGLTKKKFSLIFLF